MEGRVFVYEGRAKEFLVAREIEGADFPTPRNARVLQASPRKFISYSQRGVNLIAWKEKDLLCVIASTIPTDELFNLAREIRAAG